jgi:4-hydroxyphenylacetate 3-monooxygenase
MALWAVRPTTWLHASLAWSWAWRSLSATDRVKLFKLAWDAVGSEFGSRHTQYEMFYAGAAFVTRGHAFRTCEWEQVTSMVDGYLARYDVPKPQA